MKVHQETRKGPIYVLQRARPQTPGLRPTAIDCEAILRAASTRRGGIVATGATMAELARVLSRIGGIEREVENRTGLDGRFDFTLEWTPQPPPGADAAATVPETGPSIFTALREQLGLRLDAQRGPVRVLVIDRLERPTAN